jgi:cytoskeletal protein CcmA (bactofilin family)
MFINNRNRDDRTAGSSISTLRGSDSKRGMFSVIGPDVTLSGNISAVADLHIDGQVEGDVTCGSLAQGGDSRILGSVLAETARLAGTVEGTVRAKQLTVERSARIVGDVEYETITIELGGQIDGRIKHVGTSLVQPAIAAVAALPRATEANSADKAA